LRGLGHEVVVANPRNLAYITRSANKNDKVDAEKLARLARVDVTLLGPVRHRSERAQLDLAVIRGRECAVEARTKLINAARGLVKSVGERLKACDSEQAGIDLAAGLTEQTRWMVTPLLESVDRMNETIGRYNKQVAEIAVRYPEIRPLTVVYGVGELTALAYVLTLEDPKRFHSSRDVGAYLGMKPRVKQSSGSDPQLPISKNGDRNLRRLLVQSAHCILRQGAPDSDLRRWGLRKLEQEMREQKGGRKNQNGKKRILVAVARRLAVLLHRLWTSGAQYDPLYEAKRNQQRAVAA
jgi:transposase